MRPPNMLRLPASLAVLVALSLPAFAASWSSFENTFPALSCQDGWAACVVDGVASGPGALKDAAGRPLPADARFGWFDLKPTQNVSPFTSLSAYTGAIGGEVAPPPPPVEVAPVAQQGGIDERPVAQQGGNDTPDEVRPVAQTTAATTGSGSGTVASSGSGSNSTGSNSTGSNSTGSNSTGSNSSTGSSTTSSGSNVQPTAVASNTTTTSTTTGTMRPNSPSSTTTTTTTSSTPTTTQPTSTSGSMRPGSPSSTTTTTSTTSTMAPTSTTAQTVSSNPTATTTTTSAVAPVASAPQDDTCDDLVKLEPAAMMGQLRVGQNKCLEGRVGSEGQQTTKDKISRLMITNAEAKGDKTDWERLMKRHLEDIDRSDPDLCFKYALHLSRGGSGRAQGVIRWADYALENKAKWSGQTYKTRVFSLYKLRAEAANKLWQDAEKEFAEGERSDDKEAKAAKHRGQAKDYAREWLDYAKASAQDTKTAMALCVSSSGNRAFCEGG
jgi:hypothetical protein